MPFTTNIPKSTNVWADAECDGRPAEYRWRTLLKADQIAKIFAPGKIPLGARAPENVYMYIAYQPRRQPNIVQSLVDH